MSTRPRYFSTALVAVLITAFLVGLSMANARFTRTARDANEFLPGWEGAHAWLSRGLSPYDAQVSASVQRRLYGREAVAGQGEDLGLFAAPLPSMLLYAPWGLLDYPAARAGWMTVLEVSLVLSALLAVRLATWRPPAMLLALIVAFGVAWSPGIRSIVAGQTAILALVAALAALTCIERRWDAAAGILLALALADPLVGLLLLVAGLAWAASRRRWRIVGFAVGTTVGLVGASVVLVPGWPLGWLQQMARVVQVQQSTGLDWGLLSPDAVRGVWILLAVLGVAAAWALWACLGKGARWLLWSLAALMVLGSWMTRLVAKEPSSVYLLPAVVLTLGSMAERSRKTGDWIAGAVLLLIGAGSWGLYLSASMGTYSGVIGTSAGPALAALGLLWARWWVTRGAEVRRLELGGPQADQA